ncbi:MAG TPA: PAS domain S-box protein [Gemmata sp.]
MSEPVWDELCGSLDSAPDPVVLVDNAGLVAFVNAPAEHVFGYPRAELVGAPAAVLVPEWDRLERAFRATSGPGEPHESRSEGAGARHQTKGRFVLVTFPAPAGATGSDPEPVPAGALRPEPVPPSARGMGGAGVRVEAQYRCRDGRSFRGLTTMCSVRTEPNDPTSGPRPAEDRPGAARFRALFEATTAGMVEVSHEHRIITANPAFCLMTGYTAPELNGMPLSALLFPEDRAHTLARFDEVAAGTRPADEGDRRYRRKDGSALWVRASARARHEGGTPPGVSAVLIDLTDRRHLEEQVQRVLHADAIGLRASCLAHDFNNLLAVISGCAAILLDGNPDDGLSRDLVREVAAACQRAAGLTSQLLAVGRDAPTEPRALNLNEVVSGGLRLLRRHLGPRITLVGNLADALPSVKANPTQLEQAILNLVINAKDAMPSGGLLTVETRAVRVRPEDRAAYPDVPPGEYVQLAVSDTGQGMPDEVKARAFEPFFTTKDVGKGTGLGLAVVRAAVTQCGGRVAVFSEPGVGTVFELVFPTAGTPALPSFGGTELVPRCPATVLLVERDGTARRLAGLALRAHGAAVLEAADRAEALELSQHHPEPIALVLTGTEERALAGALAAQHPNVSALVLGPGASITAPHASGAPPFTPVSLVYRVCAAVGATA